MKTNELRDWLFDYAEVFSENDGIIYGMYWTMWKRRKLMQIHGSVDKVVIIKLIDYLETEVEERE
jgi:hypothetical protein